MYYLHLVPSLPVSSPTGAKLLVPCKLVCKQPIIRKESFVNIQTTHLIATLMRLATTGTSSVSSWHINIPCRDISRALVTRLTPGAHSTRHGSGSQFTSIAAIKYFNISVIMSTETAIISASMSTRINISPYLCCNVNRDCYNTSCNVIREKIATKP